LTDKRLIAAGAGNPPVVVDETADIERAALCIVAGASFDNNIVCADEKEIIAVDSIADRLKQAMSRSGAYELTPSQGEELARIVLSNYPGPKPTPNKKWIGKDAVLFAREIGITVPDETRLLFVETDKGHPFAQLEMMMPVIPLIRVPDADTAIDVAIELEHGYHHTAAMHSRLAGLGFGGEGWTTMTISTPTGEGVTCARTFVRLRRCVLVDHFRIV
jgi:aldehyde dehydrogenase